MSVCTCRRFQTEIILAFVRRYYGYDISYRDTDEMMHERDIAVDHSRSGRLSCPLNSPEVRPWFHSAL